MGAEVEVNKELNMDRQDGHDKKGKGLRWVNLELGTDSRRGAKNAKIAIRPRTQDLVSRTQNLVSRPQNRCQGMTPRWHRV